MSSCGYTGEDDLHVDVKKDFMSTCEVFLLVWDKCSIVSVYYREKRTTDRNKY